MTDSNTVQGILLLCQFMRAEMRILPISLTMSTCTALSCVNFNRLMGACLCTEKDVHVNVALISTQPFCRHYPKRFTSYTYTHTRANYTPSIKCFAHRHFDLKRDRATSPGIGRALLYRPLQCHTIVPC